MATKKGKYRLMTVGEIALVSSLFKTAITTTSVKIHNNTYLPFQSGFDYAVTPNGEIYWPEKYFREDYSLEDIWLKRWFMHEMTHVWQYQMGYNVKITGLLSWSVKYKYTLKEGKLLANYGMEQQAEILADYFILENYGLDAWYSYANEGNKDFQFSDDISKLLFWIDAYKQCLYRFLINPSDKKALFK